MSRRELLYALMFVLMAVVRAHAATTQPDLVNDASSYVDKASQILSAQEMGAVGPRNPLQPIDATVTTPRVSTTQPTSRPTTTTVKKGELLIVPLQSYRPTFGWGINMMGGYLFPMDKDDPDTPLSTVALFGMYSQNESWGGGVGADLHFDHDVYRLKGGVFTGEMNYDFFGIGTNAALHNISIPLKERVSDGLIEPLFQVSPDLYLGPRYMYARITSTTDISALNPPPQFASIFSAFQTNSSAAGINLEYDTRDNQFYPRRGILFDAIADFHATAIGDTFNYQTYKVAYNQYFSLSPHQVIAVRGAFDDSSGNVPFYALSQIGAGPDLRGYKPGQFQDKLLLAGQAEYRLELTKRLGLVGFAGTGEVAPNFGKLTLDQLLPSVGAGVRLNISEANHVNLRLDAAWGREGWQGYLAIGEAF